MNLQDDLRRLVADAVRSELAAAQVERPAPYPVAVSITQAAELLSTSASTIRRMLASGRLRQVDLGDIDLIRIPTVALFELDPEYTRSLNDVQLIDPP